MAVMIRTAKAKKLFHEVMGKQKEKKPKYSAITVQLPQIQLGYKQYW
jgi:hypothetical protein